MAELGGVPVPVGEFAGRHVFGELEGVAAALLNDEVFLRRALRDVLVRANATVLEIVSRQFEPQGVTVLALLSESHASIHTYPEIGSTFVDVFTCGTTADPALAIRLLATALDAGSSRITTVVRGGHIAPLMELL